MVKKTLVALALVAFLASTAPAGIDVFYFGPASDGYGVKVEGSDTVMWPYEYKALDICSMPVKMEIGMYVEVEDCAKKKIVLQQVDCGDIGKGTGDFPCYYDCETFNVRANFDVKLGTRLEKVGSVINKWSAAFDGTDVVIGDGTKQPIKVCVSAWQTNLYNGVAGTTQDVGTLIITAKPDV